MAEVIEFPSKVPVDAGQQRFVGRSDLMQVASDLRDLTERLIAVVGAEGEIKAFEAQTDRLKVEGELALQARDQEIARLRALVEQLSGGTIQAAA